MDTASISLAIAISGLVLQLLGLVVAGVWVVAKISGTTTVLTQAITALKESVDQLRQWVSCVDDRTNDHTAQIAHMQGELKRKDTT
jgi:hypothetical protein